MPKDERARDELQFVGRINGVLQRNQQPKIERLGQIYSDVTANLLTTFRELDHYPHRQYGEYLGAWSAKKQIRGGDSAETLWPDGEGLKVYAYLKPFRAIKDLLRWLGGQGCPMLVVGDGLNVAELAKSLPPNVRLADRHIDLATVVKSCDLAIMNGNHGTCCEFLLAGRPVFHIPLTFEQAVFSRRTHELGVSLDAVPNQTQQIIQQLSAIMKSGSFRDRAEIFAAQYVDFDSDKAIERCTGILEQSL
ncbi:nucleotide disphospho-sugar-binding domain-containing protein [Bremerella sp. JC817]|uniref:glycosyltransferase n=1 Tax=Bremerella sp. JC817 TaxID=3231756 RepID=UPI00345962F6